MNTETETNQIQVTDQVQEQGQDVSGNSLVAATTQLATHSVKLAEDIINKSSPEQIAASAARVGVDIVVTASMFCGLCSVKIAPPKVAATATATATSTK